MGYMVSPGWVTWLVQGAGTSSTIGVWYGGLQG